MARKAGLRAEVDPGGRSLGKQIKVASAEKIPVFGVVGKDEVEGRSLSLKSRKGGELGSLAVEEAVARMAAAVKATIEPHEVPASAADPAPPPAAAAAAAPVAAAAAAGGATAGGPARGGLQGPDMSDPQQRAAFFDSLLAQEAAAAEVATPDAAPAAAASEAPEGLEELVAAQGAEVRRLKEEEGLGNKDPKVEAAVAELLRLKAMMPQ